MSIDTQIRQAIRDQLQDDIQGLLLLFPDADIDELLKGFASVSLEVLALDLQDEAQELKAQLQTLAQGET